MALVDASHCDVLWVVYDLEFVGPPNDFANAHIWDVGAAVLAFGPHEIFQGSCVPCAPIPPPVSAEYRAITKKWLLRQPNVTEKRNCLQNFIEWLLCTQAACKKSKIVLLSHGNFRSDKVVLESECRRHALQLPDCIYFFDTLPLFRKLLPHLPHYSVNAISNTLLRAPTVEHRALADALLLQRCLHVVGVHNISGCIYKAYAIPLQTLTGVGSGIERSLVCRHGVSGAYDLASRCVALRATRRATCRALLVSLYHMRWSSAKQITPSLLKLIARVPGGATGVVRGGT